MSTHRFVASGTAAAEQRAFAEDVEYYLSLSPRQLPSRYLYDELGSALFEAICRLPWYGITRTELHLLATRGRRIFERVSPVSRVIELGPGNGEKLATLLRAADVQHDITAHLVDISPTALLAATRAIGAHRRVRVVAHETEYESGLASALSGPEGRSRPENGRARRRHRDHALVLCLGSNVGNFDPPDAAMFLQRIRASLAPGDALLLGADLVKPERDLLLAYDDPLGVSAAFNRNLLVRANRDLGTDFDLDAFVHRAAWNQEARRVEMHLVSTEKQRVHVPGTGVDITFDLGEQIWTESSYKFEREDVHAMLKAAGFSVTESWAEDGFALALAHVAARPGGSHV